MNNILYIHTFFSPITCSKRQHDAKKSKHNAPDLINGDSIFQLLSTATSTATPLSQSSSSTSSSASHTKSITTTAATSMPSFTCGTTRTQSQSFTQFIVPDSSALDTADEAEQKPTAHVPFDWGLKTKLRLLTLSRITGNGLKTCQEASGITRCGANIAFVYVAFG